jgi:hypothetical protein
MQVRILCSQRVIAAKDAGVKKGPIDSCKRFCLEISILGKTAMEKIFVVRTTLMDTSLYYHVFCIVYENFVHHLFHSSISVNLWT